LGIDEPYSGSLVPMKYYQKNRQVKSIMLEVNRKLYMGKNYTRGPQFDKTKEMITEYLKLLRVMEVNNLKNAIFDH
jgi:N-formylglutamate amidohydrolase